MLTRIHPVGASGVPDVEAVDVSAPGALDRLRSLYEPPEGRWLRLNLISAVSGDAAGTDGTSETLSNSVDRAILAAIRDLADAVVVGAASVRAEGYRVPKRSRLVVVTSSGDLAGHRITTEGAGRVVVLCPPSSVPRVRETLGDEIYSVASILPVPASDGIIAPAAMLEALRDAGMESLVCEGGPSLAGQLLHDQLVDELCLSTSPVVIGSGLPVFGRARFDESPLELTQLLVDSQSALYARWRVLPRVRA